MENASKALIIAGAVLISILLISLGVMIYRNAADIAGGTQMKDFEITAFNSKFTQYEGRKSGSQVKTLIQDCLSSNINEENTDRLLSVALCPVTVIPATGDFDSNTIFEDSNSIKNGSGKFILGTNLSNNGKGSSLDQTTDKDTISSYRNPMTTEIKNGSTYLISMHYSVTGSNKGLVDCVVVVKES